MSNTIKSDTIGQAVVATYKSHSDAEDAVRRLPDAGVPINHVSIIGRNFESREDIQGFYLPADAARVGAEEGAWFGGLFGLMLGAMGLFVFPVVGAILVLGPLAGLIAGAIGGAGIGAMTNALMTAGIPQEQALKYQERIKAGEFMVMVHGSAEEVERARICLQSTNQIGLETHGPTA